MYDINDTIAAISSAPLSESSVARSIIRLSGDKTYELLAPMVVCDVPFDRRGVSSCTIKSDIEIPAKIYKFQSPNSYTGEDLAELHFFAPPVIVENVLHDIVRKCRLAGPGEFTLRAYLNGKLDLSQAEAVSQIVAGSNKFQLAAAEKLLAGRLCASIAEIRNSLLDIMSLLEAGMDFSEEDIQFISAEDAAERMSQIKSKLNDILAGSIRYEELIDMPSVGLAGAANAGKSSLLNALLKKQRSIISDTHGTTRDILTDVLDMGSCRCAVFDCAGLGEYHTDTRLLDDLAQQAAIEALNCADLVVFCVDAAKEEYSRDLSILNQINPGRLIPLLTKADLVTPADLCGKLQTLKNIFKQKPVPVSVFDSENIDQLRKAIETVVVELTTGSAEASDRIAINQRHKDAVQTAIKNVEGARYEILAENDELAAVMLREAYESLSGIEREDVDEKILDRIFSSFCIGK